MQADCAVCHGAGIVHPLLESGSPDYSRTVPCECTTQEAVDTRAERLQRYSNLGRLSRLRFENLLSEGRSGSLENRAHFRSAYEAARAFAADPRGWFVLAGPSGAGKTHMAVAIVNDVLERGMPAYYISAPDLLDHLRSAFTPESELSYDELFNQVRNAPLLVLDDLGVQSATPWAREKLDQLLTHRFNNELPTVLVYINTIDQLDDRLRTRLGDERICQLYFLEQEAVANDYTGGLDLALLRSMTFESFDYQRVNLPQEVRENLENVYREAMNFAQVPEGWLVIQGVNGCGKTHLAVAVANYNRQQGKPALFLVVPEFLDHLRSTFGPDSRITYDELFERAKKAPLLVLDDFGEQSTTPWAQEKLYQVINYRYNGRLPTVITTTASLEEIESRISSRLADPRISLVFNVMAPDFRADMPNRRRKSPRRERGR